MHKDSRGTDDSFGISARWAQYILQGMPVLMDAFDAGGHIVVWNAECERVSGYPTAEIIGNPAALANLYPDMEYRTFMLDQAAQRRDEDYSSVWELTAKDGSRKTVEWFNVGARLKVPGWSEWAIGIDITERRRLEIALQEATTREQRRIAFEIHDGLGQELSGLSLLATGLAKQHADDQPRLADDLRQLAALASRSVTTCRQLAQGLAPLQAHENSLVLALRRLASDNSNQLGGPTVLFCEDVSAESMLSAEANNQLYRVAQEALNNALKHSGARIISVQLCVDRFWITLRVNDDGRGLSARPRDSGGMGMKTMRDRIAAIDGQLSISINDSGGTTMACECPNRFRHVG